MGTQWIVVANASRARVLEQQNASDRNYTLLADLEHPNSRLKGEHLASDRPGRVVGIGHCLGFDCQTPVLTVNQRAQRVLECGQVSISTTLQD